MADAKRNYIRWRKVDDFRMIWTDNERLLTAIISYNDANAPFIFPEGSGEWGWRIAVGDVSKKEFHDTFEEAVITAEQEIESLLESEEIDSYRHHRRDVGSIISDFIADQEGHTDADPER